ncbi:J domain-containing protein [Rhodoblastus sp.]|uniref:J domain-containing protein n=1 Tax=Rhodoblastus sp. TaxID=1962975 RepID=UPI003F96782C
MANGNEWSEWVVWDAFTKSEGRAPITKFRQAKHCMNALLAEPFDEKIGWFELMPLLKNGRVEARRDVMIFSPEQWEIEKCELMARPKPERAAPWGVSLHQAHRLTLGLPPNGPLSEDGIRNAFRRAAKKAHPDVGGSDEEYQRITDAQEALLQSVSPRHVT